MSAPACCRACHFPVPVGATGNEACPRCLQLTDGGLRDAAPRAPSETIERPAALAAVAGAATPSPQDESVEDAGVPGYPHAGGGVTASTGALLADRLHRAFG